MNLIEFKKKLDAVQPEPGDHEMVQVDGYEEFIIYKTQHKSSGVISYSLFWNAGEHAGSDDDALMETYYYDVLYYTATFMLGKSPFIKHIPIHADEIDYLYTALTTDGIMERFKIRNEAMEYPTDIQNAHTLINKIIRAYEEMKDNI